MNKNYSIIFVIIFTITCIGIGIGCLVYYSESPLTIQNLYENYTRPKVIPEYGTNMCIPNNYNKGIGTIPLKKACSSGQRDDGTSCWEDRVSLGLGPYAPTQTHIVGKGCCNGVIPVDGDSTIPCESIKRCEKYGGVHPGWINEPCTCRRAVCNGTDEYIGLLCYPKCPSGSENIGGICWKGCGCIKKTLFDRQYCESGKELIAGLCYPKCETGWTSNMTMCFSPVKEKFMKPHTPVVEGTSFKKYDPFQRDSVYEGTIKNVESC